MPGKSRSAAVLLLAAFLAGPARNGYASAGELTPRPPAAGNGHQVEELQQRLYEMGYLDSTHVDGIRGPLTQAALAAFQRDYGLVVTGTNGRLTRDALRRAHHDRVPVPTTPNPTSPAPTDRDSDAAGAATSPPEAPVLPGQTPAAALPPPFPWLPPPEAPVPPPVQPPGVALPGTLVLGYCSEDWNGDTRSLNSLLNSQNQVNLVVTFQYRVNALGELIGSDWPNLMAVARREGQPVLAIIHNFQDGGFSAEVARQILATPENRQQVVDNVAALLKEKGLDGVNVDLENIPPGLRAEYTDFVARLQARLNPMGLQVTLSIPAKVADNPRDLWSGAFDYAALAPLADLIMLMTYDEHTPGQAAGPVASAGWVEQVIRYALTAIPASKILMGIPQYGYDWLYGTTRARALSIPAITRLIQQRGATVVWDEVARVPYFLYWDDQGLQRVVYYENAESLKFKLEIMKRHGVRGIAIWKLGMEDPEIWPLIERELRDQSGQ